jgi:hypothetical protein
MIFKQGVAGPQMFSVSYFLLLIAPSLVKKKLTSFCSSPALEGKPLVLLTCGCLGTWIAYLAQALKELDACYSQCYSSPESKQHT